MNSMIEKWMKEQIKIIIELYNKIVNFWDSLELWGQSLKFI